VGTAVVHPTVQLVVVELLVMLLNQVWAQAGRQSTRRMASLDKGLYTGSLQQGIGLGHLQANENTWVPSGLKRQPDWKVYIETLFVRQNRKGKPETSSTLGKYLEAILEKSEQPAIPRKL